MQRIAQTNYQRLINNPYPGRGIIQGMTPDGRKLVQVYWIMGRSENSRNRIFVEENGFVKTHPFDPLKMKDPSLIIYYPIKHINTMHIVSNGDQTDTIYDFLSQGSDFFAALLTREFEPDAPNYTPRISGFINLSSKEAYSFSVIKSSFNNPLHTQRESFVYENAIKGFGHCVHTYENDGQPLPSFDRTPFLVPLHNDRNETLSMYAKNLNQENLVSLLVKHIDINNNEQEISIYNVHRL